MRRKTFVASLCLTVITSGGVYAEEVVGWKDAQGKPLPESDSLKSSKGFGGSIILTEDPDWKEKWARPDPPHFTTTDQVKLGGNIVALVFFTNPARDANGKVLVLCDYLVLRPDGSVSQDVKSAACANGRLEGAPESVRLAGHLVGFTGEASDIEGTWLIKVRLTDVVRGASVDLVAKFDYRKT